MASLTTAVHTAFMAPELSASTTRAPMSIQMLTDAAHTRLDRQ